MVKLRNTQMALSLSFGAGLLLLCFGFVNNSQREDMTDGENTNVVQLEPNLKSLDPNYFLKEALVKPIVIEKRKLVNGSEVDCWVIVTKATPADHKMGPWAPKKVTDTKEAGGIWFKDGTIYDVDGKFVSSIGTLYNDSAWNLVRPDGTVKVTDTREAFEGAARPDVDPKYNNYVVEVPDSVNEWKSYTKEYVIPVTPMALDRPIRMRPQSVGVAFNGVPFDPPAPVDAIIAAHTIAPFDDHGGHVNPHVGYHYHAAMGSSKEVVQKDGHSALIGFAMDGYGIYAHLDSMKKSALDLDEFSGHTDELRGYHYHVGKPGGNQILRTLKGVPGTMQVIQNH